MPEPVCEAPIRHIDHIQRYSDGGLTIYPNGRGACERGNYPREMSGWKVEVISGRAGRATPHDQDHNPNRTYLSEQRVTAVRVSVSGPGEAVTRGVEEFQAELAAVTPLLRSIRGTRSHIDSGC